MAVDIASMEANFNQRLGVSGRRAVLQWDQVGRRWVSEFGRVSVAMSDPANFDELEKLEIERDKLILQVIQSVPNEWLIDPASGHRPSDEGFLDNIKLEYWGLLNTQIQLEMMNPAGK